MAPDDPHGLIDKAARCISAGKLRDASLAGQKLIQHFPGDPRGWHILSDVSFRLHRFSEATAYIHRALNMAQDDPALLVQLARRQAASGAFQEALETAGRAQERRPLRPSLLDGIGAVYSACDKQVNALRMFELAVAGEPGNAHFLYNLAAAQRFAGRFTEAESTLDSLIRLNPKDYGAYHMRSDLRTQTPENNHIVEIQALLEAGDIPWRGRVFLHYAIGKEYEDTGGYDRAFESVRIGACLRRQHSNYSVTRDVEIIDRIIASHTVAKLASGSGFDSDEPIFVVGMPRTGTTLVERMLASHSAVTAAGELRNFASEMIRVCTNQSSGDKLSRETLVDKSLNIDMGKLGRSYIDSTRPKTGSTPRFIDKLPLNFLYCGLIRAALPRARIIHVSRDAMDTCWAVYKSLFSNAYPFSYDLEDLGQYYLAYSRLMDHWHEQFSDGILRVEYEQIVDDPEREARRMVEFCGLQWEDRCLDFQNSAEPSTTASAVQVRRPVYRSSVGKWKHYIHQLSPLQRILADGSARIVGKGL